jgi:hypothetical protein
MGFAHIQSTEANRKSIVDSGSIAIHALSHFPLTFFQPAFGCAPPVVGTDPFEVVVRAT